MGDNLNNLLALVPHLRGIDITAMNLDARDGFVLSRIDGVATASLLSDLTALDSGTVIAVLTRLETLGAIHWRGATPVSPPASGTAATGAGEFAQHPAMREPGDLSTDERRKILAMERALERGELWQVLSLAGDPGAAEVRRAYLGACKAFHPDRYFGRDIGSFRTRLERVFRGIRQAYDVLGDAEKRAAYARRCPPPPASSTSAAESPRSPPSGLASTHPDKPRAEEATAAARVHEDRAARERRLNAHRAEIAARRRARFRPPLGEQLGDKNKKAAEMYALGRQQLRAGQIIEAAASLKLATTFRPGHAPYMEACDAANGQAQLLRAKQLDGAAAVEAAAGHAGLAGKKYAQASDLVPNDGVYAERAAEQLAEAGEVEDGLRYALRAVSVAPKRLLARKIAARLCEEKGDKLAAREHLLAAVALDAEDREVKNAIKRLAMT